MIEGLVDVPVPLGVIGELVMSSCESIEVVEIFKVIYNKPVLLDSFKEEHDIKGEVTSLYVDLATGLIHYTHPTRGDEIASLFIYTTPLSNDELFLECLRRAGVDNWDGYDYAVEDYQSIVGDE